MNQNCGHTAASMHHYLEFVFFCIQASTIFLLTVLTGQPPYLLEYLSVVTKYIDNTAGYVMETNYHCPFFPTRNDSYVIFDSLDTYNARY